MLFVKQHDFIYKNINQNTFLENLTSVQPLPIHDVCTPTHPDPFPPLCMCQHFPCLNVLMLWILKWGLLHCRCFVCFCLSVCCQSPLLFLHAPTHPDPFSWCPFFVHEHVCCVDNDMGVCVITGVLCVFVTLCTVPCFPPRPNAPWCFSSTMCLHPFSVCENVRCVHNA